MSDYSLMNPDHLAKEIRDLENTIIPDNEAIAKKIKDEADKALSHILDQYEAGNDTITLTHGQAYDVISALYEAKFNTWRYTNAEKFAARIYRLLQQDRRWIVGSKLKFLKKN